MRDPQLKMSSIYETSLGLIQKQRTLGHSDFCDTCLHQQENSRMGFLQIFYNNVSVRLSKLLFFNWGQDVLSNVFS